MGGSRSSATLVVIVATFVLAHLTTDAHEASMQQHLRHRILETRDYEYLGCFKDDKDDRILGYLMSDAESTMADFCYDYCVGLGASWMATQWSRECWCAMEEELEYERHGEGAKCNRPCAGDAEEMCGGNIAFDLYRIGPSDSTPDGAFVDDIIKIISVSGGNPRENWADSYSVGDKCFMYTTFDHDIGDVVVDTPTGSMTIRDLFDEMGPGPGADGYPLYNDIQCGNGPENTDGDETDCPGLVEYGSEGCGQIGPTWDLSGL